MLHRAWDFAILPLLILVVIAVISALLLGAGTLLTFLFAVSVWEATIVVMVVAAGTVWFFTVYAPRSIAESIIDEAFLDDGEPRITIADPEIPSSRSRRRRRR